MPRPMQSFMVNLENPKPMAAFITTATLQTIPNNVLTTLTFATPINVDPGNVGSWRPVWTATSPGQFTVSVQGWYLVGVMVRFAAAANFTLALTQSGTFIASVNLTGADLSLSTVTPCAPQDVLSAVVFQASGAGINTAPAGNRPNFWVIRVG